MLGKNTLIAIVGKQAARLIAWCTIPLIASVVALIIAVLLSWHWERNPIYLFGEPFGASPRPYAGIISHWYLLKLERTDEKQSVARGRYKTEMNLKTYPVSAIMGWHLTCENVSGSDRDLESIFLEPTDGTWTIYLEHTTNCNQIGVNVLFASRSLASARSAALDRPAPVGNLDSWPEMTAEQKSTPKLIEDDRPGY